MVTHYGKTFAIVTGYDNGDSDGCPGFYVDFGRTSYRRYDYQPHGQGFILDSKIGDGEWFTIVCPD